jgi:hypothetical protein
MAHMRRLSTLLGISLALLACSRYSGNLQEREAYWRSLIAAELQPNASRSDVEAFFQRHGLEHGYTEQLHSISAIERNVAGDSLVSFGVIFSCQLNSANTLTGCTVSHMGTGP